MSGTDDLECHAPEKTRRPGTLSEQDTAWLRDRTSRPHHSPIPSKEKIEFAPRIRGCWTDEESEMHSMSRT